MLAIATWENFYVIVGSSAGALTGLTFVVISLIAGRRVHDARLGLNAFTTPIIVNFSAVLLMTALLSAPWPTLLPLVLLLAVGSLGGLFYAAIVIWRLLHVRNYEPEWDDWMWFGLLPPVAYTGLLASAVLLSIHASFALFVTAGGLVLLLAVGLRDAWDVVTFLAFQQDSPPETAQD